MGKSKRPRYYGLTEGAGAPCICHQLWSECEWRTHGTKGGSYKGFNSLEEAKLFLKQKGVSGKVLLLDESNKSTALIIEGAKKNPQPKPKVSTRPGMKLDEKSKKQESEKSCYSERFKPGEGYRAKQREEAKRKKGREFTAYLEPKYANSLSDFLQFQHISFSVFIQRLAEAEFCGDQRELTCKACMYNMFK